MLKTKTLDRSEAILDYWLREVDQSCWYVPPPQMDETIRARFMDDWHEAIAGHYDEWVCWPQASLALILLLDQFPRNMFRGDVRAFKSDKKARCKANKAIARGFDMRTPEPQRQFYYLPLMHSESLTDQERCIRLIKDRLPQTGPANLLHAKAHREVIRKFGRFPYRNDALHRAQTELETDFISAGGYGHTLRQLQA